MIVVVPVLIFVFQVRKANGIPQLVYRTPRAKILREGLRDAISVRDGVMAVFAIWAVWLCATPVCHIAICVRYLESEAMAVWLCSLSVSVFAIWSLLGERRGVGKWADPAVGTSNERRLGPSSFNDTALEKRKKRRQTPSKRADPAVPYKKLAVDAESRQSMPMRSWQSVAGSEAAEARSVGQFFEDQDGPGGCSLRHCGVAAGPGRGHVAGAPERSENLNPQVA